MLQSIFSKRFLPFKPSGGQRLSSNRIVITLLLITALTAALRLYHLDASGLWVDEIFTAVFASPDKSLAEVMQRSLPVPWPSPPLWFFITHFFMKLFGVGDFIVRLPSVVAGVLGILAMYKVGEALFDRTVGLTSAFLLTVSPCHVYFSREARFYAAIILFSLLTIYFLHWGTNSNEKKWWIGFTLATLINVYIHLTAFFVLAAEVVYLGLLLAYEVVIARKGGLRKLFRETWALPCRISLSVLAVCYLPIVPYLLTGIQNPVRGLGNPGGIRGLELSADYFLDLLANFGAGPGLPLLLYLGACLWGMGNAARTHKRQMLLFLLLAVVPFVIVLLLSPKQRFRYKYVIFILPVYLLTISLGLTYLTRSIAHALERWQILRRPNSLQPLSLAALVAIYGLVSIPAMDKTYAHRVDRWRNIGQLLTDNVQPEDAVMVSPTAFATMSTKEIMAYYSSPLVEANTVMLENVGQIQDVLASHRRVWVLVSDKLAGEVVTWISSQPRVELAVGGYEMVYMGQGQSQLVLLKETEHLTIPTAEAHSSIAETYHSLGMWAESIAAYERAAAMEPDRGIWSYRMAILYDKRLGRPKAALAKYQRAIDLEPEIANFHAALGGFYRRTDRPHKAIVQYEEAIRLYLSQNKGDEDATRIRGWRDAIRSLKSH